ncbi:hypothetical protein O0L34_g16107 [Tuta absoluta]|nr:hypothetical protein O0L34_g16107 [Tuta absoluta]
MNPFSKKRSKKVKAPRYSSSSEEYGYDSSSTASSSVERTLKRRRRRRRSSRQHQDKDSNRMSRLEKHISNLSSKVDSISKSVFKIQSERSKDCSRLSREASPSGSTLSLHPDSDLERELSNPEKELEFKELETTVKNKFLKSSENHVEVLNKLQHFNTPDWSQVRYSDAQKCYSSVPGFVELESNDLVKHLDRSRSMAVSERSLAAISHGLIMQHEALQKGISSLVNWLTQHDENSPVSGQQLCDKVNELFDSEYNKISVDLLQMVCGRRADIVQQRRDLILNHVRDKYLKESLRKIPPTSEHLFNEPNFSDFITKHGGISKVFMTTTSYRQPAQGGSNKQPLAQRADYGTSKLPDTIRNGPGLQKSAPAQGRKRRAVDEPFRGSHNTKRQRRPPARGNRRDN